MSLQFAKMHGLGNDFVVVDGVSMPAPTLKPAFIRALADRRCGIGFDQFLLLQPPADDNSDFFYRVFNADGGEVGQCGNGVRAAHIFLLMRGLTQQRTLCLSTITTHIHTQILDEGDVRALMPPAIKHGVVQVHGRAFYHLEIGNPHYVCLDGESIDSEQLQELGVQLNSDVQGGVNVGAAQIDAAGLRLRVYERGAGITAACGSGALAAAIAAIDAGLVDNPVSVVMPGGILRCGVADDDRVWLEGAVSHVFDGTLASTLH